MKLEDLTIETIDRSPRDGQQAGMPHFAIRVTHIPTGISAQCHSVRSQFNNRNVCVAMIEYGLAELGWKDQ